MEDELKKDELKSQQLSHSRNTLETGITRYVKLNIHLCPVAVGGCKEENILKVVAWLWTKPLVCGEGLKCHPQFPASKLHETSEGLG